MAVISNPILRGFNPDPSIVRVGDDFYVATSTFEWFPGVLVHHSRDLVHWRLLARPLDRLSLVDMRGDPPSGGIWAPCLTFSDGLFHLIFTDVKSFRGAFKDTHNYLATAPSIQGPWSDPIYLNSSGFDGSLFHDADGRKWFVNMLWDHRKDRNRFGGILLQEYDPARRRLVGPIRNIFAGTSLGVTEAPHLYRRGEWYYLMTAEGGTSYSHAVTLARSRRIEGPYEVDPANPILTSAGRPELDLQKAGHASLVETQTGEWYMVHLCGRPLRPRKLCPLGRETAIQRCFWNEDGWLRIEGGDRYPMATVPAPDLAPHPFPPEPARDDFDGPALGIHFQTLRVPPDESLLSLRERPGWLRLRGQESPSSNFRQSLVCRRWQSFRFTASTCVEFEPETFQQMAGLICFYDGGRFYYLRISHDERLGKCVGLLSCVGGQHDQPAEDRSIEGQRRCWLRVNVDHDRLWFEHSADGCVWQAIGPVLDAGALADEAAPQGGFTGAFVGVCAQDLSGRRHPADFDWFEYREAAE